MEPRAGPLPRAVEDWAAQADPAEQRTVIVRVQPSIDPQTVAARLEQHGMQVQSPGPGAVVAITTPSALTQVSAEPWVLAIEEPSELFMRSAAAHRLP